MLQLAVLATGFSYFGAKVATSCRGYKSAIGGARRVASTLRSVRFIDDTNFRYASLSLSCAQRRAIALTIADDLVTGKLALDDCTPGNCDLGKATRDFIKHVRKKTPSATHVVPSSFQGDEHYVNFIIVLRSAQSAYHRDAVGTTKGIHEVLHGKSSNMGDATAPLNPILEHLVGLVGTLGVSTAIFLLHQALFMRMFRGQLNELEKVSQPPPEAAYLNEVIQRHGLGNLPTPAKWELFSLLASGAVAAAGITALASKGKDGGVLGLGRHISCANSINTYIGSLKRMSVGALFKGPDRLPVDEASCILRLQAVYRSDPNTFSAAHNLDPITCACLGTDLDIQLLWDPLVVRKASDLCTSAKIEGFQAACMKFSRENAALQPSIKSACLQLAFVSSLGYSSSYCCDTEHTVAPFSLIDQCSQLPYAHTTLGEAYATHGAQLPMLEKTLVEGLSMMGPSMLEPAPKPYADRVLALLKANSSFHAVSEYDRFLEEAVPFSSFAEQAIIEATRLRATWTNGGCVPTSQGLALLSLLQAECPSIQPQKLDAKLAADLHTIISSPCNVKRPYAPIESCRVCPSTKIFNIIPKEWVDTPLTALKQNWRKLLFAILAALGVKLGFELAKRLFSAGRQKHVATESCKERDPPRPPLCLKADGSAAIRNPQLLADQRSLEERTELISQSRFLDKIGLLRETVKALDAWKVSEEFKARYVRQYHIDSLAHFIHKELNSGLHEGDMATEAFFVVHEVHNYARVTPAAALPKTVPEQLSNIARKSVGHHFNMLQRSLETEGRSKSHATAGYKHGKFAEDTPNNQRYDDVIHGKQLRKNMYRDEEQDHIDLGPSPSGGDAAMKKGKRKGARGNYRSFALEAATGNACPGPHNGQVHKVDFISAGGGIGSIFRATVSPYGDSILALGHVVGPQLTSKAPVRIPISSLAFATAVRSPHNWKNDDVLCIFPYQQFKPVFGITTDLKTTKLADEAVPGDAVHIYSHRGNGDVSIPMTARSGHLHTVLRAPDTSADFVVHDISTMAGDCGTPLLLGNGSACGIHLYGALAAQRNCAVLITAGMLDSGDVDAESGVEIQSAVPIHPYLGHADDHRCRVRGDYVSFTQFLEDVPEQYYGKAEYKVTSPSDQGIVVELNEYHNHAALDPHAEQILPAAVGAAVLLMRRSGVKPMRNFDFDDRYAYAVEKTSTMSTSAGYPCTAGVIDDSGQRVVVQTKADFHAFLGCNPAYAARTKAGLFSTQRLWSAFPKIEARKIGKAVRAVIVQPVEAFLATHTVCNDLNTQLKQLGATFTSPFTGGWSPFHGGNALLRRDLTRAVARGWYLFESDFTKFDKHQHESIGEAEYDVRRAFLPQEAHAMLDAVMRDEINTSVLYPNGDIHLIKGGNKSGSYNTARSNDIRNLLYMFCYIAHAFRVSTAEQILEKFNRHVYYRILGDDGVSAWDPEEFHRFNPHKFKTYLDEVWGMDLKVGGPFNDPNDVPFLGCTSVTVNIPNTLGSVAAGDYAVPVFDMVKLANTFHFQLGRKANMPLYYSKICNLRTLCQWCPSMAAFMDRLLNRLESENQFTDCVLSQRLSYLDIVGVYLEPKSNVCLESLLLTLTS